MNEGDPALTALKATPIFCGLAEKELLELVRNGKRVSAEPGACLITEGEKGSSLLVVLSGEIEVVRNSGHGEAQLARMGPGAFVGEMALIDDAPRNATVRSVTTSEILEITRKQFDQLLEESPDACRNLVKTVLRRLKSTEAMLVNQEKLAGLGRLAAGLAHELNNPASAVSRFADQLEQSLGEMRVITQHLTHQKLPVTRLPNGNDSPAVEASGSGFHGSALELSDREADLAAWLQNHRVGDPWENSAELAAAGWTVDDLGQLDRDLDPADLPATIRWISTDVAIGATLQQLKISAERLSQIVGSVKTYSHMDRSAAERTDVNAGLQSTLVILKHKLRSVDVHLDLHPDLPEIDGYPGELNQVWTNLIDNAIDAMGGSGRLEITTSSTGEDVTVRVIDSGPGISDEHMKRLFEPFFTTKEVGVGTGLGLHISHNIVVQRHSGSIECISRPGRTEFIVTLPVTR
jgi:signal transduction histidine kinase